MNKPTDPLEEVREKIAWEVLSKMVTIDHVRVDIADMIYEYADQILSITLKRGGKCPECKERYLRGKCPTCNGTGEAMPFTIADAIRDKIDDGE